MKTISILITATIILAACSQPHHEKVQPPPVSAPMPVVHADTSLKRLAYDSKRDLVCGMPLSAGITDTAHYQKKLYGFCSKECKEDFVKDPGKLIGQKKK